MSPRFPIGVETKYNPAISLAGVQADNCAFAPSQAHVHAGKPLGGFGEALGSFGEALGSFWKDLGSFGEALGWHTLPLG